MIMKSSFVAILPLLLLNHTGTEVVVNAQTNNKTNDSIKCIDLADFYYEIILSVTSFPEQGDCTEQEEAEIAALLQKSINTQLSLIPGTIKTKNKICSNSVNKHRRLTSEKGAPLLTHQFRNETLTKKGIEESRSLLLTINRNGRRPQSFIYVGGGRCRFCFIDNHDARALSPVLDRMPTYKRRASKEQNLHEIHPKDYHAHRHSLNIPVEQLWKDTQIVPDASQCTRRQGEQFFYDNFSRGIPDERWKNGKAIDMGEKSSFDSFLGPYIPGETFGIVMGGIPNFKKWRKSEAAIMPVTAATIEFDFWEIDIPNQFANKFWGDDPLYLYINGIKIDLGLLITTPNARSRANDNDPNDSESDEELLDLTPPVEGENDYRYGKSFAGIGWSVIEANVARNYGFGPQVDRRYKVELYVPKIIFDHTDAIDFQFLIKQSAKAKKFGIDNFLVMAETPINCKITGLEESPFDEFKAVMERKLRNQLGLDVAKEFQNKAGHCLKDRIPVVDIHLVEKEKWTEANPRCK